MLDKDNGYKPTEIQDIVFGDNHAKTVVAEIVSGVMPFPFAGVNGIILYGPNGTGKSALARILPTAIESKGSQTEAEADYEFHKITAATDGKELIEQIAYKTQLVPFGRFRYFVFDEFDLLSPRYVESMKSVMNTELAVFIMTTNSISKIDNSIKSRSHLVHMPFAGAERWLPTMRQVLLDQQVMAPKDQALLDLVPACKHDARKIMNATLRIASIRRENGLVIQPAADFEHTVQDAA